MLVTESLGKSLWLVTVVVFDLVNVPILKLQGYYLYFILFHGFLNIFFGEFLLRFFGAKVLWVFLGEIK